MSALYSREQIFIDGSYAAALKEFEKAVLRAANGFPMNELVLLQFAAQWFSLRDMEEKKRRAREDAWRQYWSGKRAEVKALFDRFDLDGSGVLSREEIEQVLPLLGGFFGYLDDDVSVLTDADIDGLADWMKDAVDDGGVGSGALFDRLDQNQVTSQAIGFPTRAAQPIDTAWCRRTTR